MSFLSKIAPTWALKRATARQKLSHIEQLKIRRTDYESSSRTRRNIDYRNPLTSADSAIKNSRSTWRKKVRFLETTQPFVAGPIKRIANNVVGSGFILQSKSEKYTKEIEKLFKKWSYIADIRRINTFSDMMKTAQATIVRDGEVLLIGRESDYIHRDCQYCIEILEVDRLQTPRKYINNPSVIDGIKYDSDGAPKKYYILKNHPGDSLISTIGQTEDYETINAEYDNGNKRVIHLFNPVRPEQSRGFSQFASSLEDFENLDKYTNAEIYAAIEDACLTGIISVDNPDSFQQNFTEQNPQEPEQRLHEFGVNQMLYLNPNESITMHAPTRPNGQLGEMINQLIRGPANALDIPPEVLAQNFQGMNYSNARTVLLQFQHSMRLRQKYLIDHAYIPIFNNLIKSLVVKGSLSASADIDDLLNHNWIPPGWQWVDPLKEAKGKQQEVDSGFDSVSSIIASRGQDPDEVFAQRKKDADREREINPIPEVEVTENEK